MLVSPMARDSGYGAWQNRPLIANHVQPQVQLWLTDYFVCVGSTLIFSHGWTEFSRVPAGAGTERGHLVHVTLAPSLLSFSGWQGSEPLCTVRGITRSKRWKRRRKYRRMGVNYLLQVTVPLRRPSSTGVCTLTLQNSNYSALQVSFHLERVNRLWLWSV